MYKIRCFLTVKYFMKYFCNISVFNEIFQNATSLCSTCFFLPQGATAYNYLVMLNTYSYVVLGWNTTSTSFFTLLKTILLWLGFGPVDKHVANIAQKREGLL